MAVPIISIQVRHSAACGHKSDPIYRRCGCKKHLYWHYHGKMYRVATGSRTWAGAERRRREVEKEYEQQDNPQITVPTVTKVVETFLASKRGEGLSKNPYDKYKRELVELIAWCEEHRKFFITDVTLPDLGEYRLTWEKHCPSSQTRQAMQGRLRGFFRYAQESGAVQRSPAAGLKAIKMTQPPVIPLTAKQYTLLLAEIPKTFTNPERAQRVRALVRLMRSTGLAIRDALTLPQTSLVMRESVWHVVTSRAKTGVNVCVPIPNDVADEVRALKNGNATYFWWTGNNAESTVKNWQWDVFKPLYKAARMPTGHSHQLRHTAAVGWLSAGIPMEEVSKLLGHSSIKVTEKSYSAWVKVRQDRLTKLVVATWQANGGEHAN